MNTYYVVIPIPTITTFEVEADGEVEAIKKVMDDCKYKWWSSDFPVDREQMNEYLNSLKDEMTVGVRKYMEDDTEYKNNYYTYHKNFWPWQTGRDGLLYV